MTAQELLEMHAAWIAADRERMKCRPAMMPRNEWRRQNPIPSVDYPMPRDTRLKSRPRRFLRFIDQSSRLFVASGVRFVEVIDLKEPDADVRLSRYDFS